MAAPPSTSESSNIIIARLVVIIIHCLVCIALSIGNLGRVDYISDFEYDLFIRPDTCNPRYVCVLHE